mgnify:CR=1 FL=1
MELRFVYITMDGGHHSALHEAARRLKAETGITMHLGLYNTPKLRTPEDWARLERDLLQADFIFGCMIFGEEYVRPLQALLEKATAPIGFIISNPALIYTTRLGGFVLSAPKKDEEPGLIKQWLQKLRPKKDGNAERQRQTSLMKNLTKLMKYVPGKVRDLHTFIALHDFWIHSSPENLKRMMALLIDRYVPGGHGKVTVQDAIEYADMAIYHPDAPEPFGDIASYVQWRKQTGRPVGANDRTWQGSVGLLTQRAIILSGNTEPLDTLIRNLEAQGLEARTVYSAMLDFRPAVHHFLGGSADSDQTLARAGLPKADALMNLMGFPLVGGPAGARPDQALSTLESLDVGYFDMIPLSYQSVDDWQQNDIGLVPIQTAMNIALPELDGAAEPMIYGGPIVDRDKFVPLQEELTITARRMARHVRLHRKANADKKIALVLFNFPPNLGNAGTAMYLDVFESVYRLLQALQAEGYQVDLPDSTDALRKMVVEGNATQFGTDCNVAAQLPLDDYRRLFPAHTEIEPYWGYAPGELLTNGKAFYIMGAQLGNIFVGVQPSFGYERDPMRLLMGKNASPHHGFAAFYTWLEHVYDADAVLHFGTHGALEFMPGKQVGVSANCWPTRLIGSLPNYYYYCVNNPSEASIAKRRGAATLVSYLVPPLQQAGLYKGLRLLKDSIDNYHRRPDPELLTDIHTQAERLGITVADGDSDEAYLAALGHELIQVEHRMIPLGLHVLGRAPQADELADMLALVATFKPVPHPRKATDKLPPLPALIAQGLGWDYAELQRTLKTDPLAQARFEQVETLLHDALRLFVAAPRNGHVDSRAIDAFLKQHANIPDGTLARLWAYLDDLSQRIIHDHELTNLLHSLNAGFIPPSPGNDVVRNDAIVPTGRNIHALDPMRVPTASAHAAAKKLVEELLKRLTTEQGALPESIAMMLWGTDNLKSDAEGVAQVMALIGVRALDDELGNVADVELIPLEELGRPRIDVVMTLSGIFRDLFHHQIQLLDKAMRMVAAADEPVELNFIRKHALAQAAEMGISLNEAATRIYCNAPGAYGANVNHLVESSTWDDDSEISNTFLSRKSFAFSADGSSTGSWFAARDLMERNLATVDAAFQNIDSFELGISDVDHYYEYLGGVTKSVEKLRGQRPPVLVADAIGSDRLASIEQMVRLESRTKLLNPKWHDAMLTHGYEGVREIELRVSNTYGWSATAGAVEGWVYNDIAETFLLDEAMRTRMAKANPHATAAIARRLLEAEARGFWDASDDLIDQLREIYGNLEDQLEGVTA